LLIYYGRPEQLKNLKYTEFFQKYNTSKTLPQFYSNNTQAENEKSLHQHYFKIYIYFSDNAAIQYIYVPLTQVKRCTHLEVIYITSGDIYYLRLIHLMQPVLNDEDSRTFNPVRGGGEPIVFLSYQQSAIAHGYVTSADDAQATFDEMCRASTAAQCRSYFVILTLQGYATNAIFDIPKKRALCIKIILPFKVQCQRWHNR
jgi:hypothetical protein